MFAECLPFLRSSFYIIWLNVQKRSGRHVCAHGIDEASLGLRTQARVQVMPFPCGEGRMRVSCGPWCSPPLPQGVCSSLSSSLARVWSQPSPCGVMRRGRDRAETWTPSSSISWTIFGPYKFSKKVRFTVSSSSTLFLGVVIPIPYSQIKKFVKLY